MEKLPLRLENDPILEALVEFRFSANASPTLSELLPGILFTEYSEALPNLEKHPNAKIPAEIRVSDPQFFYKPLYRLTDGHLSISIGDRVVSYNCSEPYIGWDEFRPKVLELINFVRNTKLIEDIERFSLKYINIIPIVEGDSKSSLSSLKASVQLGDYDLVEFGCNIRTEIEDNGFINIVNVISDANVEFPGEKEKLRGTILDIDTIYRHRSGDFWADLEKHLDEARVTEKRIFFSLLSNQTLDSFQPIWEITGVDN